MNFINPPENLPKHVTHSTFYSQILQHEIGYNIYLPPQYETKKENYPVEYHIHGWMGNESSDVLPLQKTYQNGNVIVVFLNAISAEEDYVKALNQIEDILINELIPYIDAHYKTDTKRESRSLSGFSMGGNMAFYYAIKYLDLFGAVCAYAGTYHHLYHKEYRTVGVARDKIMDMYEEMLKEKWFLEENNILYMVREKASQIKEKLRIELHIGTADILLCDNEILHLYLNSLHIPHEYKQYEGADHNLEKIV